MIIFFLFFAGLIEGFSIPHNNREGQLTRVYSDVLVGTNENANINKQLKLRRGTTVALITPMDPVTGNVDYNDLRSLLQYHVKSGTDNLCILGTTGEAAVLSDSERSEVLKVAVEECKGIMPIMAGTGTIDPKKVKAFTQQAADIGCDAALVVTPYYVKPPQRGLIQHFLNVADMSSGLPIVMYNVPGRTGVNMNDESVAIAAQHPNIVAFKDATGNMDRIISLRKTLQDNGSPDLLLYSGDDGTTVDFIKNGGHGCISVTCNVAAKEMHDIVHAALNGDLLQAYEMNKKLALLHDVLFIESSPMPCKYAASKLKMISSAYARPPLDYMDPKFEEDLNTALRESGLLAKIEI